MITKKSFRLTLKTAALVFGMFIAACNIKPDYPYIGQLDGGWISGAIMYSINGISPTKTEWIQYERYDDYWAERAAGTLTVSGNNIIFTTTKKKDINSIWVNYGLPPPATATLNANKKSFTLPPSGLPYRRQQ